MYTFKGWTAHLFMRFFEIFPLKNKIVFSSFNGRNFGDNPRAIYEKLLEKRELLEQFPCFSANFFNNKDLIIENTFGDYDTKGIDILDCFYKEVKEYYSLSTSRK